MTRHTLLQEALKLPHAERADVAAELLASLDDDASDDLEDVEKAWPVEIERRARRVLTGESVGAPWSEVKRRIEGCLAKEWRLPFASNLTPKTSSRTRRSGTTRSGPVSGSSSSMGSQPVSNESFGFPGLAHRCLIFRLTYRCGVHRCAAFPTRSCTSRRIDAIRVLAFAHHRRRTGYWIERHGRQASG